MATPDRRDEGGPSNRPNPSSSSLDRDRDRPSGDRQSGERQSGERHGGERHSADRPVRSTEAGSSNSHRAPREPRRSLLPAVLASLVLGILIGGAAMAFFNSSTKDKGDAFGGVVDTTRYQAVILSNDKVYFGRISSASDEFYRLQNAFFLRETPGANGADPVRALLPVNREIHAPENSMLIRSSEVVLVENLAKDSPILTEIKRQLGKK
jgi:hypothetical protein